MSTTFVMRCSFCGREDADVAKLIAGPGVYICDGCVATCQGILEQDAADPQPSRLPTWDDMTDEEVLERLPRIAAVQSQVEHGLREWVQLLRSRGVTWERIGAALGMTRQSAWERLSGEE